MSIGSDPRIQAIIEAYREGEYDPYYQQNKFEVTPGQFYNPIYDLRTEQIKAGELEEGARFPKMDMEEKKEEEKKEEEPFDPCPPGYQLVGGVCQPDTMFQRGGGGSGQQPEVSSGYVGDINLRMANDPVNTELRRFAAQEDYQPTFGSTLQDLFRKGMQLSPMMGLLNTFGLGPSYTETVTPRFEGTKTPQGAFKMAQDYLSKLESQDLYNNMLKRLASLKEEERRSKKLGDGTFKSPLELGPKSYTGGPTIVGKSGMLGGGV